MSSPVCRNCGAALSGHFCSSCGQKAGGEPVSVGRLAGDLFEDVFQIEGRLWRTLVALLLFPGRLTRAWAQGQHARYSSPLRIYIVCSFVLFGLLSWALPRSMAFNDKSGAKTTQINLGDSDHFPVPPVPVLGTLVTRINDNISAYRNMTPTEAGRRFGAAFAAKVWLGYALVIPLVGLLLKLLYIRRGRFWVEHVVFGLHTHAFTFLLVALGVLVQRDWMTALVALALPIYYWLAMRTVYQQGWMRTTLKLLLLMLGYLVVWTLGLVVALFASIADGP